MSGLDPQQVAASVLGPIEWESAWAGYCRCPGEGQHTQPTGRRDCLVRIDGAPTVYCFHASCVAEVAQVNARLRRELGGEKWELRLPGGQVLRSGGVAPVSSGGAVVRPRTNGARVAEIEARAREALEGVLEECRWTRDEMVSSSPVPVKGMSPKEQFVAWLSVWPADATVWTGDVADSGSGRHASRFRSVPEWVSLGAPLGNFTCASSFFPGSTSRCVANVARRCFLVVESDVLGRDEVGAVFRYMQRRLHYRLHCVVDSAGKSLHGWFDVPRDATVMAHLKAGLTGFGCDPKMFGAAQPVRVPGAVREGKVQQLLWISTKPGR